MTIYEASDYLGVPVAQLIRWAGFGVGPKYLGHPLAPQAMRYERADLDGWKNAHKSAEVPKNTGLYA
jgi:hypothetical protein